MRLLHLFCSVGCLHSVKSQINLWTVMSRLNVALKLEQKSSNTLIFCRLVFISWRFRNKQSTTWIEGGTVPSKERNPQNTLNREPSRSTNRMYDPLSNIRLITKVTVDVTLPPKTVLKGHDDSLVMTTDFYPLLIV